VRWPSFPNLSKLKDKVPPKDGDGVLAKPQFAKNGPLEPDTFDYVQLADGTRVPVIKDVQPSFEGVGDTLQIGPPTMTEGYGAMGPGSCAYCGSFGAHKPDCKSLARNYPKYEPRSSLGTQRAKTAALRDEMTRSFTGGLSDRTQRARVTDEPPEDDRTEMQRRFDAIAEELEDGK
jgi:hypothetical protein